VAPASTFSRRYEVRIEPGLTYVVTYTDETGATHAARAVIVDGHPEPELAPPPVEETPRPHRVGPRVRLARRRPAGSGTPAGRGTMSALILSNSLPSVRRKRRQAVDRRAVSATEVGHDLNAGGEAAISYDALRTSAIFLVSRIALSVFSSTPHLRYPDNEHCQCAE
jgi:hypothetical protein